MLRPASPLTLTLALLLLGTNACSNSKSKNRTQTLTTSGATPNAVITNYSDLLFANYSDASLLANQLKDAIDAFVANPSAAGLEDCKARWLRARPFFQQSEVGRFYDGPIDRSPDGPEGQINAWPLDESFIDAVQGAPNSGIINNPGSFPVIDEAVLVAQNTNGGEENVTTGWHAIEFLLWGQDLTAPGQGPGQRSFNDFVDGQGTNATRRRTYLAVAAELLVSDLQQVAAEFATQGDYRNELSSISPALALGRILQGINFLAAGEVRGERILVAFNTQAQEDEHSCFSDTTHLDHLHDLVGVRNVWLGQYTSSNRLMDVNGFGLRDLVQDLNPSLASEVDVLLSRVIQNLGSSDASPFELAVTTTAGRARLSAVLDDLNALGLALDRVTTTLGATTP